MRWFAVSCRNVILLRSSGPQPVVTTPPSVTASSGDVPRRFSIANERCQGEWAVIEVDIGAGACPATDEPENPCVGQRNNRHFYRAVDDAWVLLAITRSAGCDDVHSADTSFPAELCDDLPAILDLATTERCRRPGFGARIVTGLRAMAERPGATGHLGGAIGRTSGVLIEHSAWGFAHPPAAVGIESP